MDNGVGEEKKAGEAVELVLSVVGSSSQIQYTDVSGSERRKYGFVFV